MLLFCLADVDAAVPPGAAADAAAAVHSEPQLTMLLRRRCCCCSAWLMLTLMSVLALQLMLLLLSILMLQRTLLLFPMADAAAGCNSDIQSVDNCWCTHEAKRTSGGFLVHNF